MVALAMAGSSRSSATAVSMPAVSASKVDAERRSDDRGDLEQAARITRQPVDATGNDRAHALGAAEAVQLGACDPVRIVAPQRAGLDEMSPQLAQEERVSVGLLGEQAHGPLGHRVDGHARGRFDEGSDAVVVEAGDEHARDAIQAVQLGERVIERVAHIRTGLAVRRDEAASQRRRGTEPVQQELKRRPAGPLQVVEQEQHRRVRARVDEQVGRGLEPRGAGILAEREIGTAVFVRLGPQKASGPVLRPRRRCRTRLRARADARARRRPDRTAVRRLRGHEPNSTVPPFAATCRANSVASRVLPAPGCPRHEHCVPATVLDRLPHVRELFPLRRSRDERDRRRGAQRRRQLRPGRARPGIDDVAPADLEGIDGFGESLEHERRHRAQRRRDRSARARPRPR